MPRIACMLIGRPIMRSWRRPKASVQGCSRTSGDAKAAWASSAAIRRMVAAPIPVRAATASGL
jgi:hypothetical protein